MVGRRTFALCATFAALVAGSSARAFAAAPAAPSVAASDAVLRAELDAVKLDINGRHAVSPDGRWLAYAVSFADATTNRVTAELRLRRLDGSAPERVLASHQADGVPSWMSPRFSPDGRWLAFADPADSHAVVLTDLHGGMDRRLVAQGQDADYASINDLRWSPGSDRLAFLVTTKLEGAPLTRGVSVSPEWSPTAPLQATSTNRVLVVDRNNGQVVAHSPAGLIVSQVDWSPAAELLALTGYPQPAIGQNGASDGQRLSQVGLYDLRDGKFRPIADAYSADPKFSPDGRYLAFTTAVDGDVYQPAQIGVYEIAVGRLERFGEAWNRSLNEAQWLSGSTLVGASYEGMGCGLRLVDVTSKATRLLGPEDPSDCDRSPVVVPGTRRLVFVRDYFTKMSDLWTSSVDHWSPRQLTDLNPELNARLAAAADTRALSWPSEDGRYTIHGVLLTPRGAATPRPLIVSVAGGPSVVNPLIMGDQFAQHLSHPSLARGYAVLIPVTRGRGGYDRAFSEAIRRYRDYSAGPLTDVLKGIELVERMGVAAPGRVAWNGFSYGASLGAYAGVRSRLFAAAVLGDPGEADYMNSAMRRVSSYGNHVGRSLVGEEAPYTATGAEQLRSMSSLTYLDQAQTPTMLQCGLLSGSVQQGCLLLYQGFLYEKVPTELIVYPRTGHGIHEPALLLDAERRRLDWLDRWLRPTSPG